jgi:hypothetical protein
MEKLCGHCNGTGRAPYGIELDPYEASNLLAALRATGVYGGVVCSPLGVLNTGDWCGQIIQKLESLGEITHKPNRMAAELAQDANRHVG